MLVRQLSHNFGLLRFTSDWVWTEIKWRFIWELNNEMHMYWEPRCQPHIVIPDISIVYDQITRLAVIQALSSGHTPFETVRLRSGHSQTIWLRSILITLKIRIRGAELWKRESHFIGTKNILIVLWLESGLNNGVNRPSLYILNFLWVLSGYLKFERSL